MSIIINLNLNVKSQLAGCFAGVHTNSWKIERSKGRWAADTLSGTIGSGDWIKKDGDVLLSKQATQPRNKLFKIGH